MTDSDNPLTPEEEEVRRLLAESRHTGPTPPEVVARLDRVLDDLAHEPDRVAPVVDLARRRRRAASLLVAAAAVGVIGIGVAQVVNTEPSAETTSAESGGQARSQAEKPGAAQEDSTSRGQDTTSNNAQVPSAPKAELFALRKDRLTDDVTTLSRLAVVKEQPLTQQYQAQAGSADNALGKACGADQWGRGRFVPVSYAGVPAVVVFRRPVGDVQVADLFLCGSEQPVRSVTLPAP